MPTVSTKLVAEFGQSKPVLSNPRRACAAPVTQYLSVCVRVDTYSGTTGYEAAYK